MQMRFRIVALLAIVCATVTTQAYAHGFAFRSRNVNVNRTVVRAPVVRHRNVNVVRQRNVVVQQQQVHSPIILQQASPSCYNFGGSGFSSSFQRESIRVEQFNGGCASLFSNY